MLNVEQSIKNILDVGIGLLKVGEEGLKLGLKQLVSSFEELKLKGEADTSEGAQKVREVLHNTLSTVQQVSDTAEKEFQRLSEQAQKGYEQALLALKSVLGEEQYQKLSAQIGHYSHLAQNKIAEAQKNVSAYAKSLQNTSSAAHKKPKAAQNAKKTA